jgi:hypothetical protein
MALGLTVLSNQSILASQVVAADQAADWGTAINAGSGEWWQVVNIQCSVAFNASATGDVTIHARKSVDDGTTDDTEGEGTYLGTIPAPGSATTITKTFDAYDFDYLEVGAVNEDTTYTATVTIDYSGTKTTGMATA